MDRSLLSLYILYSMVDYDILGYLATFYAIASAFGPCNIAPEPKNNTLRSKLMVDSGTYTALLALSYMFPSCVSRAWYKLHLTYISMMVLNENVLPELKIE